jgi:hypothetical protein
MARETTPLEKSEENAVTRWAKANGIKHRKMNGVGNRDWPDQFFYSTRFDPSVKGVWIEMKRRNHVPTENQELKMEELAEVGFNVAWFDDRKKAIAYLKSFIVKKPAKKARKK